MLLLNLFLVGYIVLIYKILVAFSHWPHANIRIRVPRNHWFPQHQKASSPKIVICPYNLSPHPTHSLRMARSLPISSLHLAVPGWGIFPIFSCPAVPRLRRECDTAAPCPGMEGVELPMLAGGHSPTPPGWGMSPFTPHVHSLLSVPTPGLSCGANKKTRKTGLTTVYTSHLILI